MSVIVSVTQSRGSATPIEVDDEVVVIVAPPPPSQALAPKHPPFAPLNQWAAGLS